jgi:capsular exopolysaccharide synthesis family protein
MSETAPPEERPISEVREYARVLRDRKWLVIVPTLVATAAALVLSLRATPLYQSSASVLVESESSSTTGSGANNKDRGNLATDKEIVTSPAVIQPAVETLRLEGVELNPAAVARSTTVEVPAGANVLTVKFVDDDPALAARVADAIADSYKAFKEDQAEGKIASLTADLQASYDEIVVQLDVITEQLAEAESKGVRSALTNDFIDLSAQATGIKGDINSIASDNATAVTVIDRADEAKSPVSPNVEMNVAAAFAIGLVLGVALAFGADALDDRIRSRKQLSELLEAPAIGTIPTVREWRRASGTSGELAAREDPSGPVAEAYKALATNVAFIASQRPTRVLMVTSAAPGEGKTTTAANLAVALANLDNDVVVVGMDLRAPELHHSFRMSNQGGMIEVLSNPLDGAVEDRLRAYAQPAADSDHLRVLVSGPPIDDPTELVNEFTSAGYVKAMRSMARFVLIDTPPVLGVADASIMASVVDGVIFVADARDTKASDLTNAREQLASAGVEIVGAVYNNVPPRDTRYGTRYGYDKYGRYSKYGSGKSSPKDTARTTAASPRP